MSCANNTSYNEINLPTDITKFKFETTGSLDGENKKLTIQENDTIYTIELSGTNYEYLEFHDIKNGDRYVLLHSDKSEKNPSMVISSSELEKTELPTAVFQMTEDENGISLEIPYEISIGDSILKLDMSSLSKDSENKILLFKTN
jgi:hypothetical protein|tara:strand:- start:38 stop:472 length:435 start_codon:yes stop_codon:yes gene_type:complete